MRHAARQLRSWLIFDVRQFYWRGAAGRKAVGKVDMCDRLLMAIGAAVAALEQTSAGPLDCLVRAFEAVGKMASGGRRSGRAAARS
jgi:hypothetical protein